MRGKYFVVTLIMALSMILSSCSGVFELETSASETLEESSAEVEFSPFPSGDDNSVERNYVARAVFTDSFNPMLYIIVQDNALIFRSDFPSTMTKDISIFEMVLFNKISSISRTDIAITYSTFTVTDVSGKEYTFTLSAEDASKFIELMKEDN